MRFFGSLFIAASLCLVSHSVFANKAQPLIGALRITNTGSTYEFDICDHAIETCMPLPDLTRDELVQMRKALVNMDIQKFPELWTADETWKTLHLQQIGQHTPVVVGTFATLTSLLGLVAMDVSNKGMNRNSPEFRKFALKFGASWMSLVALASLAVGVLDKTAPQWLHVEDELREISHQNHVRSKEVTITSLDAAIGLIDKGGIPAGTTRIVPMPTWLSLLKRASQN